MTRKEKLIELIMKLRVMAERGTPNERVSAQNKLDTICEKYRIHIVRAESGCKVRKKN